jgi:hypothetical protein
MSDNTNENANENAFGDDPAEDDGVLEPSDSLDDDLQADVLDTGIDAGEGYRGATRFGVTAEEEGRGESLDQLLAEEEPDDADDPDAEWEDEDEPNGDDRESQARAGRLVAPDEGAHDDAETDSVAQDVGIDGGAASAEEAAVHVTDDPPYS